MLIRKLMMGLALSALLLAAGCKCCGSTSNRPCDSPPLVAGPCNKCGGNPPTIVTPPPPAAVPPGGGPAYYPPPGAPFGTSGGKI
jgi:hypothetical protein